MAVDILISCMNQTDFSIIDKSNLTKENVIVINQNKQSNDILKRNDNQTMVNTTSRGLSVSRNMAIDNSTADICLIADDDEIFVENVCKLVGDVYNRFPDIDVIIFKISNFREKFHGKIKKLKKIDTLKVSSQQISFRKKSVEGIRFDVNLGAGTPNGAGEENKFLLDCKRNGLKIMYFPLPIAEVIEDSSSTWFNGYDERYFYNRGRTTRYIYGFMFALVYAVFFVTVHKKDFKGMSPIKALKYIVKGILKNDIGKQERIK